MSKNLADYLKFSSDIDCIKKIISFISANEIENLCSDYEVHKFLEEAQFPATIKLFVDKNSYNFHKKYVEKLVLLYTHSRNIKEVLEFKEKKEEDKNIIKFYLKQINGLLPDIRYYLNYSSGGAVLPSFSVLIECIIKNVSYILIVAIAISIVYYFMYVYSDEKVPVFATNKVKSTATAETNFKYPNFENSYL